MAKAFECDRCGKFYSYESSADRYDFYAIYDPEVSRFDYPDLCVDCNKSLISWYTSGKSGE